MLSEHIAQHQLLQSLPLHINHWDWSSHVSSSWSFRQTWQNLMFDSFFRERFFGGSETTPGTVLSIFDVPQFVLFRFSFITVFWSSISERTSSEVITRALLEILSARFFPSGINSWGGKNIAARSLEMMEKNRSIKNIRKVIFIRNVLICVFNYDYLSWIMKNWNIPIKYEILQ